MDAALSGDVNRVKALIASGADVNAKDNNGWTALAFANSANSANVQAILRASGAGKPYTSELDMSDKAKWGWLDDVKL